MSTDFVKPKFIEGGCLCGSCRYRMDFPEDHDFVAQSGSCQCTQCRKQTGSFFFAQHAVSEASKNFKFTSSDSLKTYSAAPGNERGFCGNCGSFLYWKRKSSDRISMSIGSVDALYLFGEGAGDGNEVPKGGYGLVLASGRGDHEWCANEIKGVTDEMEWIKRGKRIERE